MSIKSWYINVNTKAATKCWEQKHDKSTFSFSSQLYCIILLFLLSYVRFLLSIIFYSNTHYQYGIECKCWMCLHCLQYIFCWQVKIGWTFWCPIRLTFHETKLVMLSSLLIFDLMTQNHCVNTFVCLFFDKTVLTTTTTVHIENSLILKHHKTTVINKCVANAHST